MPEVATMGQLLQHVVVTLVALGAVVVVARRVLGVFESRPAGSHPGQGTPGAGPACSHCAAGAAAQRKPR